jgi:RNA-directed DNA polymerase
MVLNGMQNVVEDYNNLITAHDRRKRYGTSASLHLIRYADDFIILSPLSHQLEEVLPSINEFLKTRGLEISQKKTKIVSIHEGFDFLG